MLYTKDEFSSFKSLTNELSKIKQKDLIADYQNIQNENRTRVFEYQNSLIETANMPCLSILSNFNGVLLDEDWGIFKVGFNICYTPST